MRSIVLRAAAILFLAAMPAAAQQTNCTSYYVGTTLYTTCNRQASVPATGGIDPTIPLRVATPTPVNPADLAMELEALRALRAAHSTPETAAPASSPAPSTSSTSAPSLDAETQAFVTAYAKPLNGEWWNEMKHLDTADSTMARFSTLRGTIEGLDAWIMAISPSFEDYKTKRSAIMRDDLTLEQVAAKLDGYYAETKAVDTPLGAAVLIVLHPDKQ